MNGVCVGDIDLWTPANPACRGLSWSNSSIQLDQRRTRPQGSLSSRSQTARRNPIVKILSAQDTRVQVCTISCMTAESGRRHSVASVTITSLRLIPIVESIHDHSHPVCKLTLPGIAAGCEDHFALLQQPRPSLASSGWLIPGVR